jgi:hypothetical protein
MKVTQSEVILDFLELALGHPFNGGIEGLLDLLIVDVVADPKSFSTFIETRHGSFPFRPLGGLYSNIPEAVFVAMSSQLLMSDVNYRYNLGTVRDWRKKEATHNMLLLNDLRH